MAHLGFLQIRGCKGREEPLQVYETRDTRLPLGPYMIDGRE